jgi:predicted esterase
MTARARYFAGATLGADNPAGPPAFPDSLIAHIAKTSPTPPLTGAPTAAESQITYSHTDPDARINPFIGKKILVLSGGADHLVPWTASEKFVDALQVGPKGRKEIFVQEGVGHDCTEEMMDKLAKFVWQESLAR